MRISDWSSDVCSSDLAFLGALHAGVVPVAANTLLTAHDYAYMLHHSRSQAVFVSGALLPILQQAMSGEHDVKHIVVSQPDGALPPGIPKLEDLMAPAGEPPACPPAADEVALWLSSSGTTGPDRTIALSGQRFA